MTAWTDFATEYHKNSGGKSFKASLKAAGKLWRARGMNKSKGRKRGGDAAAEAAAADAATTPVVPAAAEAVAAATAADAEAVAAATKAPWVENQNVAKVLKKEKHADDKIILVLNKMLVKPHYL